MSDTIKCQQCCAELQVVNIPGLNGNDGTDGDPGAPGTPAYTFTTAGFTIPAINANVSIPDGFIHVGLTSAMGVGQPFFISDGTNWGTFQVVSIPTGSSSFVAKFLGNVGDSAPGLPIALGATVTPAAIGFTVGTLPTAFTDDSTGAASDTIAAGVGVETLVIPLTSLATGLSTGAIDLLTNYVPGYNFKLLKFDFVTTIAGAGAGASQIFNLEIGLTNVTNTLTVTLSSTDTIGKVTAGSPDPIIAANVGTDTDTLSIEMAAGGTVFTSGSGYFVIKIQNMDTADAIASLATHINTLITAL